MSNRLPTYFISHGGGPWPWMPQMRKEFAPLEASLAGMVKDFDQKPKAILMISGHWEEDVATVMTTQNPPMIYDYYNFPPETYEVFYPSPGAPDIAAKAVSLLESVGIKTATNNSQGYDHGTFVPMQIMYPEADIPLFQISMLKSYDPAKHFEIGRALAPLRDEGVVIIGSGLSYHNLSKFGPEAKEPSEAFDGWLEGILAKSGEERTDALLNWESAPFARVCHKEEDHFVPLFVALGAAENDTAEQIYHQKDIFGGVTASSYKFG